MAMTVDGLVSGMSTGEMINQLMQVEAMPQAALKKKAAVQSQAVTAYQGVNTKLAALTTAAKALGSSDTWGSVKGTSSSTAAIVTTATGATAGSLAFTIDKLATTHTVTYKDQTVTSLTDAATSPVISGATFNVIRKDGTQVLVAPADRSLQAVVNAINATEDSAYRASAVQTSPGHYTLQLTAVGAGSAGVFDELVLPTTGIDMGTAHVTSPGQDAQLTVGTGGAGYTVVSASNTFTDLTPGMTVTVTQESATPVTVTTVADKDGITDKVQALVDAANTALKEIRTATSAKSGTTAGGAVAGDPTLRALSQDILSAVASGAGSVGSLAAVGIKLDRSGNLTFDKQVFQDAYDADPEKTQSYFDSYTPVAHADADADDFDPGWDTADGLARKLETIGLKATDGIILPTDPAGTAREGLVAGLITRRNESISQLNDQVAAWDTRLTTRRAALQRQYSALEVALGKLKDQQSWLSGQLASLG
jgi:flagellar hook-associated protein 2